MSTQNPIFIQAGNVSFRDVVDVQKTFSEMSKGLVAITVEERPREKGALGDMITLTMVLEPIVKVGLEFLLTQMIDWLKKKVKKDKKEGQYSIAIYNSFGGESQMVTTSIEKAERKMNSLLQPYLAARSDLKGHLFSLLGRGEPEEVLLTIVGMRDDPSFGKDAVKLKKDALAVMEKIADYKSDNPGQSKDDWDTAFKAMINRSVFDCINQLPQDLPVAV